MNRNRDTKAWSDRGRHHGDDCHWECFRQNRAKGEKGRLSKAQGEGELAKRGKVGVPW